MWTGDLATITLFSSPTLDWALFLRPLALHSFYWAFKQILKSPEPSSSFHAPHT